MPKLTPKEIDLKIIKKARETIAKPENWTRGAMARDRQGNPARADSAEACAWCSVGALHHAIYLETEVEGHSAILLANAMAWLNMPIWATDPASNLARFNDRHTHADVLANFDKAIARLEREVAYG